MRQPLRLVVLLMVLGAGACSSSPASSEGYTEGEVELGANNTGTLNDAPIPSTIDGRMAEHLRKYEGLEVGLAYQGSQATILSPIEDKWQAFANAVEVPRDGDPRVVLAR